MDPAITALLVKMFAAAAVVVTASLITERAGPFFGAMVATLPISAGPIYVILAIDHGAAFVSTAALTSLATNAITALFTTAYVLMAQRFSMLPSLAAAILAWSVGALVILARPWTWSEALLLNVLLYAPAFWLTRRYRTAIFAGKPVRRWYDVPARGIGVAVLTGAVTWIGWQLGPAAAGLFAVYPIVFTSLVAILHPRIGGPATAAMLVNGLRGLIGFAGAVSMLHFGTAAWGSAAGLSAALMVSIGWNLSLIALTRSRAHRKHARGSARREENSSA
jgi:hypothetical protein